MKLFLHVFDKRIVCLGALAGAIPAVLNHLGPFIKWSLFAKTATEWGFWVIFISLIITMSKTRKMAIVNVVTFCVLMMMLYGAVEAIFSPSGLAYFVEYERGQLFWYGMIAVLIPVSAVIWGSLQKKSHALEKTVGLTLVVAPLMYASYEMMRNINRQVIVCANIAAGWRDDICTFQQPDDWINGNYVATIVLYMGFALWWLYFMRRQGVIRKTTSHSDI